MTEETEGKGMTNHCPVCGDTRLVLPIGPKNSPLLLVSDYPGDDELETGEPLTGSAGRVLRSLLLQHDMSYSEFRVMNLYQHPPLAKKHESFEKDSLWHIRFVQKEAAGKKAILFMGSEAVSTFFGQGVMKVSGLVYTSTPVYRITAAVIVPTLNPAYLFHKTEGEVSHALDVFEKKTRKWRE